MENYTINNISKMHNILPYLDNIEFFKYTDVAGDDGNFGYFTTLIDLRIQISTKDMMKFAIKLDPTTSYPLLTTEIYYALTTDKYRREHDSEHFQLIFRFRKKPNSQQIKVNARIIEYLNINKYGIKTVGMIF